jgi:hypothetical protein
MVRKLVDPVVDEAAVGELATVHVDLLVREVEPQPLGDAADLGVGRRLDAHGC